MSSDETVNSSPEEKKKIGIRYILGWIFGILFLLAALGALISVQIPSAIFLFVAAFLLLPPVWERIEKNLSVTITGGLKVLLVLVLVVVAGSMMDDTTAEDYGDSNVVDDIPSQTGSAETETTNYFAIGDDVVVGDMKVTVTDVETRSYMGDEYFGEEADGIFVIITADVENLGKETIDYFSDNNFKLIDTQEREFDPDDSAWAYLEEGVLIEQLQPGLPKTIQIAFDVPEGEYNLEVTDNSVWRTNVKMIAIGSV
jgi:hypothetical protein